MLILDLKSEINIQKYYFFSLFYIHHSCCVITPQSELVKNAYSFKKHFSTGPNKEFKAQYSTILELTMTVI